MPPREDLILFLDLETTGVEEQDEIIEVGMSMVETTEGYPEVGTFSLLALPSPDAFQRMLDKDVVRKMHEDNGLLTDLEGLAETKAKFPYLDASIDRVDQMAVEWIDSRVNGDTTHIPLGGSGVLHFDRRFIKKYMPKLDKRLTHWAYDVGVLRRTFMKAGVKYASMDAKTHRALDDARVHADEWRYYQEVIGGLERV